MAKNIFTLSYGKDSIAQILLAIKNGISIDEIITVDMMFDESTSAFLDYEFDFVKRVDTFFESKYGLHVLHLKTLTFKEHFYHRFGEGCKHEGDIRGWPTLFHHSCVMIKRDAIRRWLKGQKYTLFLGICFDEVKRYQRLLQNQKSLLFDLHYTQADTFILCQQNNLLAPSYSLYNKRNGCFFCPFQPIAKFRDLVKNYPQLYQKMYQIGLDDKKPFHPWDKKHLLPLEDMKIKLGV